MFLCVVMMNNNDESFGWRHDFVETYLSAIIITFYHIIILSKWGIDE